MCTCHSKVLQMWYLNHFSDVHALGVEVGGGKGRKERREGTGGTRLVDLLVVSVKKHLVYLYISL